MILNGHKKFLNPLREVRRMNCMIVNKNPEILTVKFICVL